MPGCDAPVRSAPNGAEFETTATDSDKVSIRSPIRDRLRRRQSRIHRGNEDMKADIHPEYGEVTVTCSCGNTFKTRPTLMGELHLEVCSQCHPFYTGTQKIMDTAGRVDKFRRRYART